MIWLLTNSVGLELLAFIVRVVIWQLLEKKWVQSDMPPRGVQKIFEICCLSDAISCILGPFFSLTYTQKTRSKSVGRLSNFFKNLSIIGYNKSAEQGVKIRLFWSFITFNISEIPFAPSSHGAVDSFTALVVVIAAAVAPAAALVLCNW